MAESIRRYGVLQPVRVRATEHGDSYILIAGERRYRAAVKAALMQLPAIVRPAGAGDDAEQATLLIEAVLENDQRVDLDPLSRALGFQRLIDGGLTIKGAAEQLATTQARIRELCRPMGYADGRRSDPGRGCPLDSGGWRGCRWVRIVSRGSRGRRGGRPWVCSVRA